jgi:Protein of unknown function (DUF2510)
MTSALPPGWYPAPGAANVLHWWDGIRWTGEVREADGGPGAQPDPAVRESRADPVGQARDGRPGREAGGEPGTAPGAAAAWRAPAVEAWRAATAEATGRRRRLGRWLGRPGDR